VVTQETAKSDFKYGPCEGPARLRHHNTDDQKYFGGAFVGNQMLHALKRI